MELLVRIFAENLDEYQKIDVVLTLVHCGVNEGKIGLASLLDHQCFIIYTIRRKND